VVSVPEGSKVMNVMEVMMGEVSEVVVWKHHGMVASPSGGHVWAAAKAMHAAEAVHTTSAVHATEAVASHAAHHRVGRHNWRGKHRHHDSASNRDFAEHDNSPDCPRVIVITQCKMFK
jgi:hypothetical protein